MFLRVNFLNNVFLHFPISMLLFLFFKVYFYLFWERESKSGRDRERGRQNPSRLQAISTESDVGLKLTNVRSWSELKSRVKRSTNWATRGPLYYFKRQKIFYFFQYIFLCLPVKFAFLINNLYSFFWVMYLCLFSIDLF